MSEAYWDEQAATYDRTTAFLEPRLFAPARQWIADRVSGRTVPVGDVAFLMLLDRLKLKWEAFYPDGVFISTQLPNQVFCVKWDPGARARVRARIQDALPPLEEE